MASAAATLDRNMGRVHEQHAELSTAVTQNKDDHLKLQQTVDVKYAEMTSVAATLERNVGRVLDNLERWPQSLASLAETPLEGESL